MNTEPFREEMRYEYPELTPDSVVLDCGGYEGTFAEGVSQRYDCHVVVLEPVRAFYERTRERLKDRPKVRVWPFGIAGETKDELFRIKGDMTGLFADGGDFEWVQLLAVWQMPRLFGTKAFDLLKLNCEGAEFGVLERLVGDFPTPETRRAFKNIQVQWHDVVPHAEARREKIIARLSETHELTFDHGWVWQNWRLKA